MKQISNFVAECNCGYIHKFKKKNIDFNKVNDYLIPFNDVYKCPKCGKSYDGIFKTIPDTQIMKANSLKFFVSIILLMGLVFGGYFLFDKVFPPSSTNNETHMTNKELNDFLKWDHEQQQKKWENQPAFEDK
jgi:hypothetical protein